MRLLVLGGTSFVGAAVVDEALGRGDTVTTFNRGYGGPAATGVEALHGDRLDPAALGVLAGREWDAAIDTWSGAPTAVRDAARALAGRVGHYGYVSSRSVYAWPLPVGADESAPVVDGSPDAGASDYPADKRGGELAVLRELGDGLLARAGLILGPRENVGRLPWWLRRIAIGGEVLAPGPADRPLQYVDARDLARWLLRCADEGVTGDFNAVSRPGHTTMGDLLAECRRSTGSAAELTWVEPDYLAAAGIAPWTELPIWLPPAGESAGMHAGDVSKAAAAGLSCRPVADTVADTWAWLAAGGEPPAGPDRPPVGLDPAKEAGVLAAWHERGPTAAGR